MQASFVASETLGTTPPAEQQTASRALARDFYATLFTLNQRVMRDLFERLAERGLSATQFKMLQRLLEPQEGDAGISVKALGDQHRLSLATASRTVDALVQQGYAERSECPEDRRVKRVRITDAGRDALRELHAENITLLTAFLETLTDDERHALAGAIAPLTEKLGVPTTEGPSR